MYWCDDERSRGYRYVRYKDKNDTCIVGSRNYAEFRDQAAAVVDCGVG